MLRLCAKFVVIHRFTHSGLPAEAKLERPMASDGAKFKNACFWPCFCLPTFILKLNLPQKRDGGLSSMRPSNAGFFTSRRFIHGLFTVFCREHNKKWRAGEKGEKSEIRLP